MRLFSLVCFCLGAFWGLIMTVNLFSGGGSTIIDVIKAHQRGANESEMFEIIGNLDLDIIQFNDIEALKKAGVKDKYCNAIIKMMTSGKINNEEEKNKVEQIDKVYFDLDIFLKSGSMSVFFGQDIRLGRYIKIDSKPMLECERTMRGKKKTYWSSEYIKLCTVSLEEGNHVVSVAGEGNYKINMNTDKEVVIRLKGNLVSNGYYKISEEGVHGK